MDRLIYTALSGMRRAEFGQALTANNLSNAATVGFQRDTGTFQSRWLDDGLDTRVQASEQVTSTDVAAGTVTNTARPLDVALHGGALLAVRAPGGGEAYTRRGDLQITPEGTLTTGDGRPVLGSAGTPITIPAAERVEITADGAVQFVAKGDTSGQLQPADKLRLVSFDGNAMRKDQDGLLRRVDGGTSQADDTATLVSGALEGSNASPVASLVELIEQSRAFQLQTRLVSTARELDAAGTQLMHIE
jgi:flagellar basal-body rod protein FlgF